MNKLLSLALFVCLINITLAAPTQAAPRWQTGTMDGKIVAISPSKKVTLKIIKPKNSIWGYFIIPLTPDHTKALEKHRINPHYSFVPTYIRIDKIERRSTGKVNQYQNYISIELDGRQWDDLKKGATLSIELPDGTQYNESLRGSMKVIRRIEKDLRTP
ncbi:MAG: hypothetical protein COA99_04195 [Moraxellaceae bacterium]|nr:MAG: hypothetical protein COA99_04195 [Moraxellaceae bacterium]